MKELLKITLTHVITIIAVTGIIMPEIILGTPASPAVGGWYQQFLPNLNGRQIVDITFLDSLTGYAISNRLTISDTSLILKTSNAGDNWFVSFAPTGYIFKRIQFINQTTGYVGGTGLLKTTDAGLSWNLINASVNIEDLSFKSNDTGWYVYGESFTGGVFFTSTGGVNWTQQYSAGSQNPEKIYMYNARIGFISDNSGSSSIRKTTNGGLTWNINVPGEWFYDIYFIDSLTGWRTRGDTMKFTSNGGSTWIKQLMPYGGMIFSSNLLRFSVLNKDTIWGSGGYMLYPNNSVKSIIFRTTNGGNNWLFQIPDTSLLPFEQYVKFTDKNHGWYYSINNTGIHTTTGGDPVWITAIEQISSEIPKDFKLYQNYPNPFNPDTKIKFQLLKHGNAEITIYDITGRRIQKLLNEELNAGEYEIDFNASGLSSGTYFYKLTVTTGKEVFTETKKMTLVK